MEKRFFFALVLTALVIVATPLLFPGATQRAPGVVPVDSSRTSISRTDSSVSRAQVDTQARSTVISSSALPIATAAAIALDTAVLRTAKSTYGFSSRGAVPISVVLDTYLSRRPTERGRGTQLVRPRLTLASYRLVLGADTLWLDTLTFRATTDSAARSVSYQSMTAGRTITMRYTSPDDSLNRYLLRVNATVSDAPAGSAMLIDLPTTIRSNEPDTLDDMSHLAISYRPARGDVTSIGYSKLDSGEVRVAAGPITWVATRNRYFLVAFRETGTPFSAVRLEGAPRIGKVAASAHGTALLPLSATGSATFDIYAGPQDFERLQRLGGDLDQVNPYAGWLHGVVQPFTSMVMKALLWMKRTTQLNYGWVLVLFGVLIRLILWPLNQGAMRTSMRMQRLQPELQAIQKKHASDPQQQQKAIMKVYKDNDMSPFSPIMGCLPMLLPMPILFALYFVFNNTIEFRGVSFFWLPDLSLRDPYYITPLLMGVSMFVMSWIGMQNAPPNPQAKMMMYMMPVMFTVLFLNFASGLNLYYAVQNVAALPQQWMLARERAKQGPPVKTGPVPTGRRRT